MRIHDRHPMYISTHLVFSAAEYVSPVWLNSNGWCITKQHYAHCLWHDKIHIYLLAIPVLSHISPLDLGRKKVLLKEFEKNDEQSSITN